jgi:hypothetical protein
VPFWGRHHREITLTSVWKVKDKLPFVHFYI